MERLESSRLRTTRAEPLRWACERMRQRPSRRAAARATCQLLLRVCVHAARGTSGAGCGYCLLAVCAACRPSAAALAEPVQGSESECTG